MFLKKISFVLLAVIVGLAMALIRPAQPQQVGQPPKMVFATGGTGLDNDAIPLENGIHNSRKCKLSWRVLGCACARMFLSIR